jgi:predicted RNA-binding Zn ribbon-like protein
VVGIANDEIDFVHPALDLINSGHGRAGGFPDLLDRPDWTGRLLSHWGYADAGAALSERQREELIALRALLTRIVGAVSAGTEPAPRDLARLNSVLRARPVVREVRAAAGEFELRLVPRRRDWEWVLGEIAGSLADLLAVGDTDRLKVCDNPDCRFAFYDETRNRTRRWCAQTTCGNRHKVRAFRARQRARSR